MEVLDVAIIGAGPAGTAAAITLADAGRSVVVIDRATFPRHKVCGDGLTTGALRLLEGLGLSSQAVASWQRVDDVIIHGPDARAVRFPMPRGNGQFAAVAERYHLDDAMVALARSRGVVVHDGHALEAVSVEREHLTINARGLATLHARFVVGADGVWSPLRKLLGVNQPGYLGEWQAFRQYFANVTSMAATELHVWFEPDLLPGYVWAFPLSGQRANVGFGLPRGARAREMAHIWPELLKREHIAAVLGPGSHAEAPHRAWPIPARVDAVTLAVGRALFVGDAAAAADPMTGEGIGQALQSGMLAAQAIIDVGHLDPHAVRAQFEASMRRHLVADHRMARRLMGVLESSRGARGALRIAGSTDWTRRNFARWLFEDYPRAVLVTPSRWQRHRFGQPGAYRDATP